MVMMATPSSNPCWPTRTARPSRSTTACSGHRQLEDPAPRAVAGRARDVAVRRQCDRPREVPTAVVGAMMPILTAIIRQGVTEGRSPLPPPSTRRASSSRSCWARTSMRARCSSATTRARSRSRSSRGAQRLSRGDGTDPRRSPGSLRWWPDDRLLHEWPVRHRCTHEGASRNDRHHPGREADQVLRSAPRHRRRSTSKSRKAKRSVSSANRAGKTTMIRTLLDLIRPTSGRVGSSASTRPRIPSRSIAGSATCRASSCSTTS